MLTTVDNHTDSRHQSSAAVEATVESRDLGPISHQERRQEFAIPALPVLLTGNIKTQKKEYERLVEKKETNIIDKEENLVEQDRENQKGRKRYGSHDALEEQNEEIEMVSCFFAIVMIVFEFCGHQVLSKPSETFREA